MSQNATSSVLLPEERVPVIAEVDVLVAGAGSAGIAAAIAASREGAKVILVERYGSVGGMATGGLIILLLTMDDGRGRQLVGGICQELIHAMELRDAVLYPQSSDIGVSDESLLNHYRHWGLVWGRGPHSVRFNVAFDPEEFRHCANELLIESAVNLRFHSWVSSVVMSNDSITHVVLQSKAGREAVRCKVVVDATGDGDVFTVAGEEYEKTTCVPWLWFRMGGVEQPDEAITLGQGKFFPTLGGFFFRTIGDGRTLMPWGASDAVNRRIDATNPDELTAAELECRRLVMKEIDRLRDEVPGFRHAYINDIAWQLGIYESRRLLGQYQLHREDEGRNFDDTVAQTGNWTQYGTVYNIPYRCLLPKRVTNLLAAGRCISVDSRVHHSTKEIPPCIATGQAAGVAAAIAVGAESQVDRINVAELQLRLRRQGAILPPPESLVNNG